MPTDEAHRVSRSHRIPRPGAPPPGRRAWTHIDRPSGCARVVRSESGPGRRTSTSVSRPGRAPLAPRRHGASSGRAGRRGPPAGRLRSLPALPRMPATAVLQPAQVARWIRIGPASAGSRLPIIHRSSRRSGGRSQAVQAGEGEGRFVRSARRGSRGPGRARGVATWRREQPRSSATSAVRHPVRWW